VDFGDVLDEDCDVLWVEGTFEFGVIGCVLEYNGFAKIVNGGCT
jgi:hypothetical protein